MDTVGIVRCQRVSKRWRRILSSGPITTFALREAIEILSLDRKSVDVTIAGAISYIQWKHRLQCGRPVKRIFLPWPPGQSYAPCEVRYHSRRFCYRCLDREEIHMLNLETGEKSIWTSGSDVGHIFSLTLSDRYLVVVSNEMYVIFFWGSSNMILQGRDQLHRHSHSMGCQQITEIGSTPS
ncbi:hypothetical protein VTN31DRAFT_3443 [Thermomyces dupontii]|uniref:uncharacterized protein n=1 Tax=Talaromyces thermophilus TaxID=28565 RepID=UPI003743D6AE